MPNTVQFKTSVGGNGSIVTDDANPATGLGGGGHRDRFVPALGQVIKVAEFVVGKADAAANSASAAIAVATTALNSATTQATSSTTWAVALGAKYWFLNQSGKAFAIGQHVMIASAANANNWMHGVITAWNSTSSRMDVNVTNCSGSGTLSDWSISVSGPAPSGALINELRGADVAISSGNLNLTSTTGNTVNVTGSTNISTITLAVGVKRTLVMAANGGVLLHYGGNVQVPGSNGYVWGAGDVIEVMGDTGSIARVLSITRYNGRSVVESPAASSAEVRTGTASDRYVTPASLFGAIGFSAYSQTGDQTVTAGGGLTLAHGLGRVPILHQAFLKFTTAVGGYAVGDIIPVAANHGSSYGYTITSDATNNYIRFASSATAFYVLSKDAGAGFQVTNGNATFFVRSYA